MYKQKTWINLSIFGGLFISSVSFALSSPPSPYVGIQLGWGKVHQESISRSDMEIPPFTIVTFSSSSGNSGWAGRLFAGYLFDPNWAVELGWSKFKDFSTHATALYSNGVAITASGTVRTDAIDLVAKGIYPLQDNFNIYAKLGGAYLMQRASISGSAGGLPISSHDNENRLLPTFGLGASYNITCNISTDLSWNRIQKVGNSNISSTDLVSLGLIYNII